MKRLFLLLTFALCLFGCMADYDTFDTSDYHRLDAVSFDEQDGSVSTYPDEHKIIVNLMALQDSEVTISGIEGSSLATLHLVESKFKEFPSDSAALDSLARAVSYDSKNLKAGSKVRLPESHVIYVLFISESGIPSIWQLTFNVPGENPVIDNPGNEPALSSSSVVNGSSSSVIAQTPSSSSFVPTVADAEIKSLSIAGKAATIDGDHIHVDDLEFLTDLTSLEVTELVLSEGATASIQIGSKYDFSSDYEVTVTNSAGDEMKYTVIAGYQYPSMLIKSADWTNDDNKNKYDLVGWDNGNNSFTKQLAMSTENGEVLKMETTVYMGKIASGNTFTAYFNPKGENALTMLGYKDGNELIDFGRPFTARPKFVEFDAKYEGKGDSCDLYLLLENRTATANEGKNQYRQSTDVNTLVASAWYRAKTVTDDSDPDVVSISEAKKTGYTTIRMKLQYGEPLEGSPIYNSSALVNKLNNSKGIDNHLVSTTTPENFKVTHIRLVMAASANGNTYEGVNGATLYVDEIRLIY